jgi:hypothetical protein
MRQISKILFCHESLHVSGIFYTHHQELSPYTWRWVCFMRVIWPLPRRVRLEPDPPRKRPHNLHETCVVPHVQLITPDDGHSRCPKHVEFRDKIKFWILDASCLLFIRRLKFHVHQNSGTHVQGLRSVIVRFINSSFSHPH